MAFFMIKYQLLLIKKASHFIEKLLEPMEGLEPTTC